MSTKQELLAGVFESLAHRIGVPGNIDVFPDEISAGLGRAVASNNAVAYLTAISPGNSRKSEQARVVASVSDDELFAISTIMVSTGLNGNGDCFDPNELWVARTTPEDKPLNMEHEPGRIVGHITGNHVADEDLKIVVDDTALPAHFHIIADAVIYRQLQNRDEDLRSESAQLIEEVANGDWCVSMECLFRGFDYMLGDRLIERTDTTAFLTKHLRAYGGSGHYSGQAVGRVLRSLSFSALGIVKEPANPESVFLPK